MNPIKINDIIEIAKQAGKETLKIYERDFNIEYKESTYEGEGKSPLTEADMASHNLIINQLTKLYPDIPILSEESKAIPYEIRKTWKYFWLIDPLDGTKEFIKKNGEFTINIALIHNNKPILGVVYVPVKDILYYADENGSFKQEKNNEPIKLEPKETNNDKLNIVASRSHFNKETKEYIESLGKEYELVSAGSSIKLCLVAEGKADIYPRLGPTMEWDTAAAHAVVNGIGKKVLIYNKEEELNYNKENLLNPWFIVK
jgi:3'(2'), 5'-bisphosphate nucleotidase